MIQKDYSLIYNSNHNKSINKIPSINYSRITFCYFWCMIIIIVLFTHLYIETERDNVIGCSLSHCSSNHSNMDWRLITETNFGLSVGAFTTWILPFRSWISICVLPNRVFSHTLCLILDECYSPLFVQSYQTVRVCFTELFEFYSSRMRYVKFDRGDVMQSRSGWIHSK